MNNEEDKRNENIVNLLVHTIILLIMCGFIIVGEQIKIIIDMLYNVVIG